jgi:mannose-6-phosphate isomerase-like protein (cupin superfamily)
MIKKVNKKWGHEEWLVNNELYCCKKLYVKKGYQCSLHHHKNKDETFYILKGKVVLDIERVPNRKGKGIRKDIILKKNDKERILPYQYHRFIGLKNSIILEVSTHHDDNDSYRDPNNLSGKLK